MITFLNKYAGNIHSQNGEDLVTREVLRRLDITEGLAVEIGGNDGLWMSNTRALIESGWSCKFIETDWNLWKKCSDNYADNPRVKCICSHVDKYNINAFVDDKCDVLSLDTDGSDFEIFEGLKAKPKIVIVEIDSSFPPESNEVNSDGAGGYGPMVRLGIEKGFFLLCHSGNILMVSDEFRHLFPDIIGDGLSNSELYFNRAWLK